MNVDDEPVERIFECQQCGECCRGYGGTLVAEADIAAIAEYLGIATEEMVALHCRVSATGMVIAQADDGYCVFLRDRLCGIHPVKPRMCREWPFLQSVLTDTQNWRDMASACPGMKTDAPDEVIRRIVARMRGRRK